MDGTAGQPFPRMMHSRYRRIVTFSVAALLPLGLALGGCDTIERLQENVGTGEKAGGVTFASEPDIRVRVMKDRSTLTLAGPARIVVRPLGGAAADTLDTPINANASATGLVLKGAGGQSKTYPIGTTVELLSAVRDVAAAGSAESIVVGDMAYPGVVQLRPKAGAKPVFDVVIDMPVETYLPGVLEKELFKDWPRQTFEAQAVASRTYALFERDRARREIKSHDVESTDADQVFGGAARNTRAIEAVRATRGQVMSSNGQLIRAYFSSQCGGRQASAESAWPRKDDRPFNHVGPLQAKKREHWCQTSPLYRWEVVRTDDDVSRRLRTYGKVTNAPFASLTRLRAVEVVSRNDADRPERYRLIDASGTSFEISPEELRMGCNYAAPDLPPITRETRVNSGDLEITVWAKQVRIRGRGYGHGVGMCQYCARGMAEARMDWPTMLKTFYPGVTIQKAY